MKLKKQNGGFRSMLLGTLGASLLDQCYQVKERIELEKDLLDLAMDLQSKTRIFNATSSLTFYKSIIKTSQNLMKFILDIIYLIK